MADFYFLFPIAPTSKERPFVTRSGRAFTRPKTRKFEADVKLMAKVIWGAKSCLESNLEAIVTFQSKKPKTTKLKYPSRDVDNCCKAIFDALNGVIYHDDKQIVKLTASKQWADEDCIRLVLTEI